MNYESLQIRIEEIAKMQFLQFNEQTNACVKNKQESGIFYRLHYRTKRSKYRCRPPFHPPPPSFCRHSLKLLSPTLPKLMNWILLSPPPQSSDPDIPQNLERAPGPTWYVRGIFKNSLFRFLGDMENMLLLKRTSLFNTSVLFMKHQTRWNNNVYP